MKRIKILLVILFLSVVSIYLIFQRENRDILTIEQQDIFKTQTNSEGSVIVEVTPKKIVDDNKTWKFSIVLDTHSGSLDQDLLQIVELVDSKGSVYKPVAWEGSKPGGHHRKGILIFNPIQPAPEYVELKMKNVGDIPERQFRWDTK